MPQQTEISANPPAETKRPEETHSASPPPPARSESYFKLHPQAPMYLAIAAVVLLVAGFFTYRYFSMYESTDDAEVDGHLMPLSARITGYVVKVNVDDNQYVDAGTVLAEIDPRDYQVALDQANAALADAQATAQALNINVPIASVNSDSQVSATGADVENARAGISVRQAQFSAAKSQLDQAQANNVKAQNDLVRYKQLVEKQEISQQQYDQAIASAKASAANVEGARASADAAQQEVTQAEGKLVQSQANLTYANTAPKQMQVTRAKATSALAEAQRKKADLDQAELNLQYTKIIAPVNGIVSNRTVEVGQNVAPGQELMKVINLDDIWITANFKETQLRKMKINQPVDIEVDANGKTYHGKVNSFAGASGARFSLLPPENATGNYVKVVQRVPVKIVLDPDSNKDHYLRPGMSVT